MIHWTKQLPCVQYILSFVFLLLFSSHYLAIINNHFRQDHIENYECIQKNTKSVTTISSLALIFWTNMARLLSREPLFSQQNHQINNKLSQMTFQTYTRLISPLHIALTLPAARCSRSNSTHHKLLICFAPWTKDSFTLCIWWANALNAFDTDSL